MKQDLYEWLDETAKFIQRNPDKAELCLMAAYARGIVTALEATEDVS